MKKYTAKQFKADAKAKGYEVEFTSKVMQNPEETGSSYTARKFTGWFHKGQFLGRNVSEADDSMMLICRDWNG